MAQGTQRTRGRKFEVGADYLRQFLLRWAEEVGAQSASDMHLAMRDLGIHESHRAMLRAVLATPIWHSQSGIRDHIALDVLSRAFGPEEAGKVMCRIPVRPRPHA